MMDSLIFDALQAGGNLGLLIMGFALMRLDRRVFKLEITTGTATRAANGN